MAHRTFTRQQLFDLIKMFASSRDEFSAQAVADIMRTVTGNQDLRASDVERISDAMFDSLATLNGVRDHGRFQFGDDYANQFEPERQRVVTQLAAILGKEPDGAKTYHR